PYVSVAANVLDPSDTSGNKAIWTQSLGPYLPRRGTGLTGAESSVFVCPAAVYRNLTSGLLAVRDISRSVACTGTMLGRTPTGGMTTSLPRHVPSMITPSENLLVVEGRIDLSSNPNSKSCQSSIKWAEVQPDFAAGDPMTAKFVDFRHASHKVMDVLY